MTRVRNDNKSERTRVRAAVSRDSETETRRTGDRTSYPQFHKFRKPIQTGTGIRGTASTVHPKRRGGSRAGPDRTAAYISRTCASFNTRCSRSENEGQRDSSGFRGKCLAIVFILAASAVINRRFCHWLHAGGLT